MNCTCCTPNFCIPGKGSMIINGVGTVKAEPDTAVITLAVLTENQSLIAAQQENALKANAVINTLYQLGIPQNNIRTLSYTIEPQYDFVEGRQVFRGYRVANTLSITTKDLSKTGQIVDYSTANGANRVDNIAFTVENPSLYYNQALSLAIKDAVEKAKEVSNTMDVDVNITPVKITEESNTAAPDMTPMLKMSASATPILPGQIIVTARIEAIFDYMNLPDEMKI